MPQACELTLRQSCGKAYKIETLKFKLKGFFMGWIYTWLTYFHIIRGCICNEIVFYSELV
ncbi:hypothetical protein TUM4637_04200 [Shewanella hafniensis]|nr:hypothetical protein TUM4637_04200 [Shewanella hafniensis]